MSTEIESAHELHPRSESGSSGGGWFRLIAPLLMLILVGALLAFLWRVLTPYTADLGDEQEASAAVDGTLALLGVPIGVLTAAWVLIWPSRTPALRTVTAILGSLLGAVVSWLLGDQLGTPALTAVGAAFTWPVATATVIFLGALLPGTSSRLQPGHH